MFHGFSLPKHSYYFLDHLTPCPMDYLLVQPINPKNLKNFCYSHICPLLSLLDILSWHIFERSLSGWKGKLPIKSGSWLSQNLPSRNPNQVLSDNLFFHLKCAKSWLYYRIELTLVSTFSCAIVGDRGMKLSSLGYDKKFRSISWWWTRDRHSIGCDHSLGDSLVWRLYMIHWRLH